MNEEPPVARHPRRIPGLELHVVDNSIVGYEVESGQIHYMNPTAGLILELCDGNRSREEIAALVQEAYELPEAPIQEVDLCIANFTASGTVR